MTFLIFSLTLSAVVALLLLLPLLSKAHHRENVERRTVNVESGRTRLAELEQELENGDIEERDFERYRLEIETSVAEDLRDLDRDHRTKAGGNRLVAALVALIVPLLSIFIYHHIGSEQAFLQSESHQTQQSPAAELEKMLASVEHDILNDPDDVEGRIALSQVYAELERYSEAAMVYEQLSKLLPDDADILVNYAEALGRSHANRLDGRPLELLNRALVINPKHGRGLWLAGFGEMQSDNKEQARVHWRKLLAGMEVGSEAYKRVEDLIHDDEGEREANEPKAAGDEPGRTTSLRVSVTVAEDLERQLDPSTTLFVFARAAEGPPMPLAVHRGLAKDLPLTVTLDDSMAMMPNLSLSSFQTVIVGARISSSAQPQGRSGDFEGYSGVIDVGNNTVVNVLIDSIKP